MQRNNKIIVNLSSVQWARFGYRNQYGDWANHYPKCETFRGHFIPVENMFNPCHQTPVSAEEYLTQNNMLDIWQPELYLKLAASDSLVYTGEKAKSIWKAWNEKIFKKK